MDDPSEFGMFIFVVLCFAWIVMFAGAFCALMFVVGISAIS
jgi:hypothetical protein